MAGFVIYNFKITPLLHIICCSIFHFDKDVVYDILLNQIAHNLTFLQQFHSTLIAIAISLLLKKDVSKYSDQSLQFQPLCFGLIYVRTN